MTVGLCLPGQNETTPKRSAAADMCIVEYTLKSQVSQVLSWNNFAMNVQLSASIVQNVFCQEKQYHNMLENIAGNTSTLIGWLGSETVCDIFLTVHFDFKVYLKKPTVSSITDYHCTMYVLICHMGVQHNYI